MLPKQTCLINISHMIFYNEDIFGLPKLDSLLIVCYSISMLNCCIGYEQSLWTWWHLFSPPEGRCCWTCHSSCCHLQKIIGRRYTSVDWIIVQTSLVFKRGNKHLVSNYLPISLTLLLLKFLSESIINKFYKLLESHKILSFHIYRFGKHCWVRFMYH